MDDELTQQVQKRMAELPPDVHDAIISADFGKKVQAIGAKHQLHIDQVGALGDEVLLVMLAFSDPSEFVPNVVAQLHVSEDVANSIADEVSNEILRPIRESLRTFMEARAAQAIREALHQGISASHPAAESLDPTPIEPHPQQTPPAPVAPAPVPVAAPVPILAEHPSTETFVPTPPVVLPIADTQLSQKTVTPPPTSTNTIPSTPMQPVTPPAAAPAPTPRDYTTDPYHEPI